MELFLKTTQNELFMLIMKEQNYIVNILLITVFIIPEVKKKTGF